MPQPFIGPHKVTSRNPYDALTQRPELAAKIGTITATWAYIEYGLGLTLSQMLGEDAMLGITIYLALHSEGPQRTVIKAAAQSKLPSDLAGKVITFLDRLRDSSTERNRVIHGLWETAESYQDALIYMEPKDAIRWDAFASSRESRNAPGKVLDSYSPRYLVFKKKDFDEILDRLRALLNELVEISHAILSLVGRWPQGKPQQFFVAVKD